MDHLKFGTMGINGVVLTCFMLFIINILQLNDIIYISFRKDFN